MIIECIFDIIDLILSVLDLESGKFKVLAISACLGFLLNATAFGVTSYLSNATKHNTESLVLFIIIVVFIGTTFFVTCIYIVINVITNCCYRLKHEELVNFLKEKGKLIDFFRSELIVFYKHHELVFDILLILYELAISDWSPTKDILCFIVLVFSSIDFVWNIFVIRNHVEKLKDVKNEKNPYSTYFKILNRILTCTIFRKTFRLIIRWSKHEIGKNNR